MNVPAMKIDLRQQVRLSLRKSFRFCRKGISYRLFRSSLTLAVVVVAVAFFMVLLSESVIIGAVSRGVERQIARMREADTLLAHLFEQESSRDFSALLASMHGSREQVAELARVAGLSLEQATALTTQCHLEQLYTAFFQDLAVGKRVLLVKQNQGREVFTYLAAANNWSAFASNLGHMRSVRLPTDRETLRAFLDTYTSFLQQLESARAARARTIEAMQAELKGLTGGGDPATWLPAAPNAGVEQWRRIVTGYGFGLDVAKLDRVRACLAVSGWETAIMRALQSPQQRIAWKQVFKSTPGIEAKMLMLTDPRVGVILDGAFTLEQRKAVSEHYAADRHLRALAGKLPVSRQGLNEPRFLDGQQMFLVVISFLVCMAGIANAMLMAITERFREIATMKCLGATDGFILNQFLIEAAVQGLAGGTLGTLIGLLISILKSGARLGSSVLAFFPLVPIMLCSLFTLATGVLLAMLASVYPSRVAAHMAPMDAMRVE